MRPVELPPPVGPGARVGVAALSGAVDSERLDRGLDALRELGFEPVPAGNLRSRCGVLAGEDDERLTAFHELVADSGIEAIFFARGGYGIHRLLPHLDWGLLATTPRAYVGYSDVTPLLLEVPRRLGFAAFHGPMVAAELAAGLMPEERRSLLAALAGELPLRVPVGGWLRRQPAEGVLIGGCLSMLTALLGTPYAPDLDGAVLFLEDVGEPLYRVDRMLTHLALSGSLAGVNGTVLGHFGDAREDEIEAAWHRQTVLAIPGAIAVDVDSGHGRPNLTLPLGLRCRLDPKTESLSIG